MNYEQLMDSISTRFFLCNELTEKQARDYAWIAVNAIKRQELGLDPLPSLYASNHKTLRAI